MRVVGLCAVLYVFTSSFALADEPVASYVFPAGGRRGETVKVRVGGLYLHDRCPWEMSGPGVATSPELISTKTIWFEGPVIPLPASQAQEDYPKDMSGAVAIAADAPLGLRAWRTWTAQGTCRAKLFVVGDLPEVVEKEIDGEPIPVRVELPVTINGRIFPREDVDVWTFAVKAGQPVTCSALAESLGSPLDARLEIRDPSGRRVAESSPAAFSDAFVRFTPTADGLYEVRIHDLNFGGLQRYVYRLTVTAGAWVDRIEPAGGQRGTTLMARLTGQNVPQEPVPIAIPADASPLTWQTLSLPGGMTNSFPVVTDSLPEQNEPPTSTPSPPFPLPAVLNGRIDVPGQVDSWPLAVVKGKTCRFEVQAPEFGSPLEPALSVTDANGKELVKTDQPTLQFTPPMDGTCFLRIADQYASRGGPQFIYRIRATAVESPSTFTFEFQDESLDVERGKEAKLKVVAVHPTKPDAEIRFEADGLPAGVTLETKSVTGNKAQRELVFKAAPDARVAGGPVTIRASISDPDVTAVATFRMPTKPVVTLSTVLIGVTIPTPYKVKGIYEVKYAQRGGLFTRHFTLDRGGFTGPLTVSLGEKQARHLQGVTGPTIVVPPEAAEFDYTVYLPPWMEIGRTSRSVIMAVGEVTDPDGSKHKVSFTSVAQNEQIVALIDPGQLGIDLEGPSLTVVPGQTVHVTVRVSRGVAVRSPATVELVLPGHVQGVTAEPLKLATDQAEGALQLRFAAEALGPFNVPAIIRATAEQDGRPVVAETKLELVSGRRR